MHNTLKRNEYITLSGQKAPAPIAHKGVIFCGMHPHICQDIPDRDTAAQDEQKLIIRESGNNRSIPSKRGGDGREKCKAAQHRRLAGVLQTEAAAFRALRILSSLSAGILTGI